MNPSCRLCGASAVGSGRGRLCSGSKHPDGCLRGARHRYGPAVGVMGFCVAAGAGTGLKGAGAARHSPRAPIVTSILYVLFSLTGAVTGGTLGAVWGAAVPMWCVGLAYWWQFVVALRESGEPASRLPAPRPRLAVKLRRQEQESTSASLTDAGGVLAELRLPAVPGDEVPECVGHEVPPALVDVVTPRVVLRERDVARHHVALVR